MNQHNYGHILGLIQDIQKTIFTQYRSMTNGQKEIIEKALINAIMQLTPENDLTKLTKK